MGEPRDLREPEWQPPTSDEIATAEEEFGQMLGGLSTEAGRWSERAVRQRVSRRE